MKPLSIKDDPLEYGTGNKEKFLVYIALWHVCKSATKENTVFFQNQMVTLDDYRDKILGPVDQTMPKKEYDKVLRSRVETFRNRKHAGVAYEQFFLKPKEEFKLRAIPQLTSIATILGMKACAVQEKKIGKYKGETFRPKHITKVWDEIKLEHPTELSVNAFRKLLAAKIHTTIEKPKDDSGEKDSEKKKKTKLTLKEKYILLKRQVMALRKNLEQHPNKEEERKNVWSMYVELADDVIDDKTALDVPGQPIDYVAGSEVVVDEDIEIDDSEVEQLRLEDEERIRREDEEEEEERLRLRREGTV